MLSLGSYARTALKKKKSFSNISARASTNTVGAYTCECSLETRALRVCISAGGAHRCGTWNIARPRREMRGRKGGVEASFSGNGSERRTDEWHSGTLPARKRSRSQIVHHRSSNNGRPGAIERRGKRINNSFRLSRRPRRNFSACFVRPRCYADRRL